MSGRQMNMARAPRRNAPVEPLPYGVVGRFPDTAAVVAALAPAEPVYCIHSDALAEHAHRFVSAFPGRVLYAVKCNPHPAVLGALHAGGVDNFDTASIDEIRQVKAQFPEAECHFMHPVKTRAAIIEAYREHEVRNFVLDHPSEFAKLLDCVPADELTVLVRVATPKVGDSYHLASKFGAEPAEATALLRQVRGEGCRLGIAFHVGSQCRTPEAYRAALKIAGEVAEAAAAPIRVVDVGGGFPGQYPGVPTPPLEEFMGAIRDGLRHIRLASDGEVWCEPGRGLVSHGVSLIVQVLLRKENRLYINDGIYHSLSEPYLFSKTLPGSLTLPVRLLPQDGRDADALEPFYLMGPTCDSADMLPEAYPLPGDVTEGDWIEIGCCGAYSNALLSRFNGFTVDTFVEVEADSTLVPNG